MIRPRCRSPTPSGGRAARSRSRAACRRSAATRTSPGLAAPGCLMARNASQATQQLRRLEQRQADHVGIAARQEADERRGAPLDGVAAGLALPLAAVEIGAKLARVSRARPTTLSTRRWARRPSGARSTTAVITRWRRPDSSVRQARACASVSAFGRMRRPAATTVSAASTKQPGASTASALARASRSTCGRGSSRGSGVSSISVGRTWSGVIADLRQKGQPPRAGRGQDQPRFAHLNRKVIRPLDRS